MRQNEHEKRWILFEAHLRDILLDPTIYFIDIGPHHATQFLEPFDQKPNRLMAFPKSTKHIVKVAVIYAKFILEVLFELIYRHIFRRSFHFLENLVEIVVML